MSKRLTDIRDELEQEELLAKIAQVNDAWGENELALSLLSEAVTELEKQAASGAIPGGLSGNQLLTLGVSYVVDALEEIEKQAQEDAEAEEAEAEEAEEEEMDEEEDDSEETQEKQAESFYMGCELGEVLGASGLTVEDLDKLASDEATQEEIEQFGQLLAYLSVENALGEQE